MMWPERPGSTFAVVRFSECGGRRKRPAGRRSYFCTMVSAAVGTMRQFPEQTGAEMDLPAFVFDRLGYGRSDHEEEFPTDFMGDAADFLEDLLAAAGIDDCCLIGHSDGGTVALLHGARYRGRVRAIVTVAAHVRRDELTYGQILRHNEMYREGGIPDWMTRFHGERAAHLLKCWTEVWQNTLYDSGISRTKSPQSRCR